MGSCQTLDFVDRHADRRTDRQIDRIFHCNHASLSRVTLRVSEPINCEKKQELSYRKQIACQLRTQYVEGIYDNPMTVKCRLRVTEGHWKRNHCVDHTRLTISRVIWRWILSWPWNEGQRSLKIIENGTIWKLGYGFLFAFHSNYGRMFNHFGDIQRERMTRH